MALHTNRPFARLAAFGDSFLDTGTFTSETARHNATWPARSGTNPQPMWIEHVAHALGLDLQPAADGGTNHAQAYALTDGVMDAIPGLEHLQLQPVPVTEQVARVLRDSLDGNGLTADDLVIINGGGNDALLSVLAGTGALAREAAADRMVDTIRKLAATGATVVRVTNPDLGLSPIAGAGKGGDANPVTAAVAHLNTLIADGLTTAGTTVPALDGFGFFRHLVTRPTDYGLTNVHEPSYPNAGIGALLAGPDDQVTPDVSGYLFSDAIHPSATGHRLFGAYAIGVLTALHSQPRDRREVDTGL